MAAACRLFGTLEKISVSNIKKFCLPATTFLPNRQYNAEATPIGKHTKTKIINDVCVITLDTPGAKVYFAMNMRLVSNSDTKEGLRPLWATLLGSPSSNQVYHQAYFTPHCT